MREEYFAAEKVAFVDSDPMYTQSSVPDYLAGTIDDAARSRVDLLLEHDVFFTFGENIGAPDCRIPTDLFRLDAHAPARRVESLPRGNGADRCATARVDDRCLLGTER